MPSSAGVGKMAALQSLRSSRIPGGASLTWERRRLDGTALDVGMSVTNHGSGKVELQHARAACWDGRGHEVNMTGEQLGKHRAALELTQEGMASLLGCSLIGYKRFETDARPIPAYIAHAVIGLSVLSKNGLVQEFTKEISRA